MEMLEAVEEKKLRQKMLKKCPKNINPASQSKESMLAVVYFDKPPLAGRNTQQLAIVPGTLPGNEEESGNGCYI